MHWRRRFVLDGINHDVSKFYSTLSTIHERVVDGKPHTVGIAMAANDVKFLIRVSCVTVEAHYNCLTIFLHVDNVTVEVFQSFGQTFSIWFFYLVNADSTVHFQSLGSSDYDRKFRLQTSLSALDVEEFLRTEVSTESCFCDDVVAESHGETCA